MLFSETRKHIYRFRRIFGKKKPGSTEPSEIPAGANEEDDDTPQTDTSNETSDDDEGKSNSKAEKPKLRERIARAFGKSKWPTYADAIFHADERVFKRLWEYVQRRLEEKGSSHSADNDVKLEELKNMVYPAEGCRMAISVKDEEGKVDQHVLRWVSCRGSW